MDLDNFHVPNLFSYSSSCSDNSSNSSDILKLAIFFCVCSFLAFSISSKAHQVSGWTLYLPQRTGLFSQNATLRMLALNRSCFHPEIISLQLHTIFFENPPILSAQDSRGCDFCPWVGSSLGVFPNWKHDYPLHYWKDTAGRILIKLWFMKQNYSSAYLFQ